MRPVLELSANHVPDGEQERVPPFAGVQKLFSKMFFIIPLGIIGNISYSLMTTDQAAIRAVLHLSPFYLTLAFFLSIVPWFTGSFRMFIWARFLGSKIRYREIFPIVLGAELGAAITPPLVGGSPVKVGMLMRRGLPGGTALCLTMLESVEDAVFLMIMVPVALTLSSAWHLPVFKSILQGLKDPLLECILTGIGIAIIATVRFIPHYSGIVTRQLPCLRSAAKHLTSLSKQLHVAYQTIIRNGKSVFTLTLTLTAIQWICRYSIISLLLMSLGIPAKPILFMALQVIVFALMMIIPTPGGAGGAEALFSIIYGMYLPSETIGIVTASWRFVTFYFLVFMAATVYFLILLRPWTARLLKGNSLISR